MSNRPRKKNVSGERMESGTSEVTAPSKPEPVTPEQYIAALERTINRVERRLVVLRREIPEVGKIRDALLHVGATNEASGWTAHMTSLGEQILDLSDISLTNRWRLQEIRNLIAAGGKPGEFWKAAGAVEAVTE